MNLLKVARGLVARGAAAGAEMLAARGYDEHGKTLARWGMLVGGVAFVIETIDAERPSAQELKGVFWTLGQELQRMGDATAAVWLALADTDVEAFDLEELKAKCGDAMEDAQSLDAAGAMAPVWRLLERLKGKAPC